MNLRFKIIFLSLLFFIILIGTGIFSLCLGTAFVPLQKLWNVELSHIIWQLRFPRILLAILVGGALATSGTVMQVILKNPLADPYILGISSASSLGAVLAFVFHLPFGMIPICAFMSAFIAIFIISRAAQKYASTSSHFLLLTGVLLSFLFSSIVTLVLSFAQPFEGATLLFWLMGGLSHPFSLFFILLSLSGTFLLFYLLYKKAYALNLLNLGEESAHALGLSITSTQHYFFILSSLLTALAVSLSGMIGFIGLMVPHFVRLLWGGDHRLTLPLNFLIGSWVLLLMDTLLRTCFIREFPIGVLTTLIGAPLFLIILWKKST
ncbi:MAG: hypothetical protein A2Z91_04525 [Deltaproteobacteria bacterium GWA2_38_16]|nr:MAG: hypothetical protein A2Z91_04525 [Deltaproteobacteria bacterium GWA2_38_16]OGQ01731.1 MAG: hypothetical protein A3D19_07655 [Deltaproteobacteria bacterium RIFCSPHIGHO2_02_FULL_38_15]OGQ34812.1 MAG: hypothetical protein A3A72_05305 [Deltaproteobacteria bacterium RIFCSPLOWO2_01_FULL_38_9]HBQ21466.1 heme ABC transporter permease [Deltaproteobacteria bacterium]